ncbi:iron-sulfur binding protein [Sulfurifustis variabilis]|uniref:Iron-sulfur binding protein n=1 Tax=Sulfurifustis variabilis TaxID=1675686 RepID=A0A1B4V6Q4_9GAMM|nr:iron-sulfur cluster biosynthesis family protein [Sulfurifustis variabilis]BAU46964.1 iron-sulfur binding protein [Sulfurifustis variabilis]
MSATAEQLEYIRSLSQDDLRLTPAAEAKFAELLADADPELSVIRLFVTGGGCGGMSYGMTYGEGTTAYDTVREGPGYRLAVDAVALSFLRGAQIDFANDNFVFQDVFQSVGGSGLCGGCAGGRGF